MSSNLQEDRERKAAEAEEDGGGEDGIYITVSSNLQEDRERKAAEAERRLREMEEERMKLDEELKRHREKARRVNIGQEVLEAKIKVPDIIDFSNFKSLANLSFLSKQILDFELIFFK